MIEISQAAKIKVDELIQAKHTTHGPGMNAAWAALEELLQRVSNAAHHADAIAAEHGYALGQSLLAEFKLPEDEPEEVDDLAAFPGFMQADWDAAVKHLSEAVERAFAPLREWLGVKVTTSSEGEKISTVPADDDLTRYGWAPGHYTIRCADCEPWCCGMGAKRSWRCKEHAEAAREAQRLKDEMVEVTSGSFLKSKYTVPDAMKAELEAVFCGDTQVYSRRPVPAADIATMIEELRSDPASSVTILCDDEEAWHVSERLAIEVFSDWTDYRARKFRGSSTQDCLARAVAARRAAKAQGEGGVA